MSSAVDFISTTQWDANTRVVFFDWNTDQVVALDGSLVADSDLARNAAAQAPSGDPGSVPIPADAPAGTYYASAFAGPFLSTADEAIEEWGYESPLRWDGTDLVSDVQAFASAIWTYSNGTAFIDWNGIEPTNVETDPDRTGAGRPQILQSAGERGDIYINSRLAGMGWTLPLAGMDDRTNGLLRDLSNHAARWQLAEAHQWGMVTGQNQTADNESKIAKADKKYVDDWLAMIEDSPAILNATRPDDVQGSDIENVSLNFGGSRACDEFGCSY